MKSFKVLTVWSFMKIALHYKVKTFWLRKHFNNFLKDIFFSFWVWKLESYCFQWPFVVLNEKNFLQLFKFNSLQQCVPTFRAQRSLPGVYFSKYLKFITTYYINIVESIEFSPMMGIVPDWVEILRRRTI